MSEKLTSMHFYGWKKGLKTGTYYLRTKAVRGAIKFTVDAKYLSAEEKQKFEAAVCSLENPDACEMCYDLFKSIDNFR